MPFGGMLTMGLIGAGSSIFSGIMGHNAANDAAAQQTAAGEKALDFQKEMWGKQQANQAPYLEAGSTSLAALMKALEGGVFGAGSMPSFTAPTLEEARLSPGYQFSAQQGSKGILQGSAAAGGAINGGTLRALDQFNIGLADQTYGNVFNRALQGYAMNLGRKQQEFNQMYSPAALGESAVQNLNGTGTAIANNIGDLMTGIGNTQAAGTIGSTNALTSGIMGGANTIGQLMQMKQFGMWPGSNGGSAPGADMGTMANLGMIYSAPPLPGLGQIQYPKQPINPQDMVFANLPTP